MEHSNFSCSVRETSIPPPPHSPDLVSVFVAWMQYQVMVGADDSDTASTLSSDRESYAGSRFLPQTSSISRKSLRGALAATLGVCHRLVGDAYTPSHVLLRAVDRLSESLRDAIGFRSPDFHALTEVNRVIMRAILCHGV